MSEQRIKYLSRQSIDDEKWNKCIALANNELIYGYTWYLDAMANQWDALVLNEYEAVMPLPWKKKWGIDYLYQPFLTAQLGLFGKNIDENLFKEFLSAIPSKYRLWEINFNYRNVFPVPGFHIYQRKNFVLPLGNPYEEIQGNYRDNIKRNIKKCLKAGCIINKDIGIERVMEIAKSQMHHFGKTDNEGLENFRKVFHLLHPKKQAITYAVLSGNNELLASCVFLFSANRAYYILVGNHPNGKTLGASHALLDAFIKDNAGKNLILDFEGSDINSLSFFYSSFGAVQESYTAIKLNRLPWYIKWLKQ